MLAIWPLYLIDKKTAKFENSLLSSKIPNVGYDSPLCAVTGGHVDIFWSLDEVTQGVYVLCD